MVIYRVLKLKNFRFYMYKDTRKILQYITIVRRRILLVGAHLDVFILASPNWWDQLFVRGHRLVLRINDLYQEITVLTVRLYLSSAENYKWEISLRKTLRRQGGLERLS